MKAIPSILIHVEFWRGFSFLTLTAMTLWQIVIVVMTLFPAEAVQAHLAREAATDEINDHYGKLHRK